MANLLDQIDPASTSQVSDAIDLLQSQLENLHVSGPFKRIRKRAKKKRLEAQLDALEQLQQMQELAVKRANELTVGRSVNALSFEQVVAQFL